MLRRASVLFHEICSDAGNVCRAFKLEQSPDFLEQRVAEMAKGRIYDPHTGTFVHALPGELEEECEFLKIRCSKQRPPSFIPFDDTSLD